MDALQGDIVLPNQENRNAIRDLTKKWPNAQIPYIITNQFSQAERQIIARAFNLYTQKTCIRFKARTTERDFFRFEKSNNGCVSYGIGRNGNGMQIVSLGPGCIYFVGVLHEIMHVAGFWHEQSRIDRDQYIRINWGNIKDDAGSRAQFKKTQSNDFNTPYDYCSIMHYGTRFLSKNGSPTMTVLKNTNCVIGQAKTLSDLDIRKLNTLYRCSGYPQVTTTTGSTCTDKDTRCKGWASRYCNSATYKRWMNQNCAKSCGICGGTVNNCTDKDTRCSGWASRYCNSATYKQWMTQNCAKSCGICGGTVSNCTDKDTRCSGWASRYCNSATYKLWMTQNCGKSCNRC